MSIVRLIHCSFCALFLEKNRKRLSISSHFYWLKNFVVKGEGDHRFRLLKEAIIVEILNAALEDTNKVFSHKFLNRIQKYLFVLTSNLNVMKQAKFDIISNIAWYPILNSISSREVNNYKMLWKSLSFEGK